PEIYDPVTNTWTMLQAPLFMPTYPHLFLLPDGRLLVPGSDEEPMATYVRRSAAVQRHEQHGHGARLRLARPDDRHDARSVGLSDRAAVGLEDGDHQGDVRRRRLLPARGQLELESPRDRCARSGRRAHSVRR